MDYTAIIKQRGKWWIGWIEEVPGVTCQESTREELMDTLAITLEEILQIRRDAAQSAIGNGFETTKIHVA